MKGTDQVSVQDKMQREILVLQSKRADSQKVNRRKTCLATDETSDMKYTTDKDEANDECKIAPQRRTSEVVADSEGWQTNRRGEREA